MKKRHQLAAETLTGILAETGHRLAPDDLPDIIELSEICGKVERPDDPVPYDLLKLPVRVSTSGITLRPITIARAKWIAENAGTWGDDFMEYGAIAFALSVGDSRVLFEMPADHFRDNVVDLVRRLDVSTPELERCMARVMNFGDTVEGEGDLVGNGPLIVALCREYGGTPFYWLHEADIETVEAMIDGLWRKQEAEAQAATDKVLTPTVKMHALVQLRDKRKELLEKWTVANG